MDVRQERQQTQHTTPPTYFSALTALRGIAAIWVMLFHMDVIIYYRELGTLLPKTSSGIIAQGYLWVDFFFILSGFIISHVYGQRLSGKFQIATAGHYLKARLLRIYPLHFFTLSLLLVFVAVVSNTLPGAMDSSWKTYFDWQALISNLLLTNAMNQHTYLSWNIVSWSIGAEWWAYIYAIGLFYVLGKADKKSALPLVILMVFAFIGLVALVAWHPKQNLDITFDYGFLRCLFGFSIGAVCYPFFQRRTAGNFLCRDSAFVLVSVAICAVMHWQLNDLYVLPLFTLLLLCAAHNQGRIQACLNTTIPQYLGRISYSIYLMHGVCFMLFWFLLPVARDAGLIAGFSMLDTWVYALSFIALTIASSALSYRYIEVPGRKLFNSNKQASKYVPETPLV